MKVKDPNETGGFIKQNRERERRQKKKKTACTNVPVSPNAVRGVFPNRTSRKRAVNSTRANLPSSPRKKVAVIASLVKSPTTQHALQRLGYLNSPENQEDVRMASAILEDAKATLQATKRKRSNDACAATHVSLSFLLGEKVISRKLKSRVSQRLSINRKRLSNTYKHCVKTLRSDKSCWLFTERQTRSDSIPFEHRKLTYDFWSSPGISRPTGNKKFIIRKRVAVRTYTCHAKQVLEKTQTDAYLEFKAKHPGVKMSQRSFERCKPFFVVAPRSQDKIAVVGFMLRHGWYFNLVSGMPPIVAQQ